jgi:hypothetical protein
MRKGIDATLVAPLVAVVGLVAVCLPILVVPYSGDDIVNRNWALKSWSTGLTEVVQIVSQWMHNEGRFFPTAGAYGLFVWETFTSRASYTAFLTCLAVTLGLVVLICIRHYTGRWRTAAVVTMAFACGVQFRFFYDGFTSFAGLVPFSLLLSVLAAASAFAVWRGRSFWLAVLTGALWSMAITAYEVSLLMLPAIVVLIVVRRPRSSRHAVVALGALGIPTLIDLSIVAYLRANLSAAPAPGYSIAVNGETPSTALHQLSSALPLSQYLFGIAPASCPLFTPLGALLAVVLAGGLAVGLMRGTAVGKRTRQHPWALIIAGAWAWVIPSLLAGITVRWQLELPINQGYIYVVYQSLGLALLAGGVFTAFTYRLADPVSRTIATCMAILIAVALGLTAGANLNYAKQMPPGPSGPDWPANAQSGPAR